MIVTLKSFKCSHILGKWMVVTSRQELVDGITILSSTELVDSTVPSTTKLLDATLFTVLNHIIFWLSVYGNLGGHLFERESLSRKHTNIFCIYQQNLFEFESVIKALTDLFTIKLSRIQKYSFSHRMFGALLNWRKAPNNEVNNGELWLQNFQIFHNDLPYQTFSDFCCSKHCLGHNKSQVISLG